MDVSEVWEGLVRRDGGRIVYLLLDGLGGLPSREHGGTELQVARTPNLDRLAGRSSCGLLEVVGPGITPGSGPGHLAIFGYDPLRYDLGRGVLSALGIDFELKPGDVAARINFATVDGRGKVIDRRAGRIDTETNRRLCERIREGVRLDFDGEFFLKTVSEHRAVLVLRGPDLGGRLRDTDPQRTGLSPFDPEPLSEDARETGRIAHSLIQQVKDILSDQDRANMILLRGFDRYRPFTSIEKRFGLRGIGIAEYPMYRGISRLLGMDVSAVPSGIQRSFEMLKKHYGKEHDFYFLHVKKTDSSGENSDFEHKVEIIEAVDQCIPLLTDLDPEVLVVTADHSTPAVMGSHSWHPVPVLLCSKLARTDGLAAFDENSCSRGSLGLRPALHLMGLALAHAERLNKFGA